MSALAKSAAKNPEFVARVARLFGTRRPSVDSIDGTLRPFFVYREELEEVVRMPERMLADLDSLGYIEGDCDDVSTLVASIARIAGYSVRLTAVRYTPTVQHFEHVFDEIKSDGRWEMVDLTVPAGTTIRALEVMEEYV